MQSNYFTKLIVVHYPNIHLIELYIAFYVRLKKEEAGNSGAGNYKLVKNKFVTGGAVDE